MFGSAERRGRSCSPRLLVSLLLVISVAHYANGQQYSYTRDCIDQHHKEVKCFVQLVDCDDDLLLQGHVNDSQVPDEAHDIRVEPVAKSVSRRQAESYQLSVDISWQTAPNNSTKRLQGFFLRIESEDQKNRHCFLFNVSESNWTAQAISASPRLHFSTENLFRFGQKYEVSVNSLPETARVQKVVRKLVTMPNNPRQPNLSNLLSPNCSQYSHPSSSRWTAGFRRIILHPIARTIQIEFVGAPAQYCFEQYEVRLLDETGLELLHSDVISVDQMKSERIDNNTVYFGQYNFTHLDLDKSYIPSVIAVERAADGRCLCPVYGTNPYDNTVVCSCIAADWKAVKLQKIASAGAVSSSNSSMPESDADKEDPSGWGVYIICIGAVVGILSCVAFMLFTAYRHYTARGKTVRIRFIQDARNENGSLPHGGYDGAGPTKALLDVSPATALVSNTSGSLNLLIIYAHDSPEHDAAVLALADFLRDAFNFEVHLDVYDASKIERNLMDYLSSSVVNADKILLINSMGSAQRYQTKIQSVTGSSFVVERNEPTPFDSLFIQQIDMILQHHGIISVRFDYSQFNEVIVPLHGCLQYVLPANLPPLVSALASSNLKNDPRLTAPHPTLQRMADAIEAHRTRIQGEPTWFAATHHRRRINARESNAGLAPLTLLPSMSTLPTLSVGDDEEEEFVEGRVADKQPLIQMDQQSTSDVYTDEVQSQDQEMGVIEKKQPEISETKIEEVNELQEVVQPVQEIQKVSPAAQEVSQQVETRLPSNGDPMDSGCYDESGMFTTNDATTERLHGKPEAEIIHECPERIEAERAAARKWRPDENMDSGMISDDTTELQAISAT
ncbi:SEFIR domain-containing protein [Aphelenchoides bicaudatus]|nr:SEFIR domain-containing protein [Aphelenchoides bicaudatus]